MSRLSHPTFMILKENSNVDNSGLCFESFLGGYEQLIGKIRVSEVTDMALVMIVPRTDSNLNEQLEEHIGVSCPVPGFSSVSRDGSFRLVWLSPRQFLAMFYRARSDRSGDKLAFLQDDAYTTDQTDNWVILRLEGSSVESLLERLCAVDTRLRSFPVDAATRTIIEHLGVVVLRHWPTGFLLLAPSSYRRSFLETVESAAKSIRN